MLHTRIPPLLLWTLCLVACDMPHKSLGGLAIGTATDGGSGSDDGATGGPETSGSGDSGGADTGSGLPPCDPFAPECAEGEGCYDDDGAFVCAPDASGWGGSRGEPCEYVNACDAGLVCVPDAFDDCAGESCCTSYCSVSGGGCVEGETCVPLAGDVGACTGPNANVFVPVPCNPLAPDCAQEETCIPYEDGFACIVDAGGAGGAAGDACAFENVCDPGLLCLDGVTDCAPGGCCTAWCDLGNGGAECAPGQTCVSWFDGFDPTPGLEDLGTCL